MRIAVCLQVDGAGDGDLQASLRSLQRQSHDDWVLFVGEAALGGALEAIRRVVGDRVRVIGPGTRIEPATAPHFVTVLRAGDAFAPGAFAAASAAIGADPGIDVLYGDELIGEARELRLRPVWSPELFLTGGYLDEAGAFLRYSLLRIDGPVEPDADRGRWFDRLRALTRRTDRIERMPAVLYERARSPIEDAGSTVARRAAAASAGLAADGIPGRVAASADGRFLEIDRLLLPETLVSVVIPTRGSRGVVAGRERVFVVEAVRSLIANAGHDRVEIVVVWDTGTDEGVLEELRTVAGDRLLLVEYDAPFNYSDKCNRGVLASGGEIIVLLNDDTEAVSDGLIPRLCGPLLEPGVGMTGALLLYEDGTIQHAGQWFAEGNHWGHLHVGEDPASDGSFGSLRVDREVSGVTAACAAIRRSVFVEVGGLSPALPNSFNDVDLAYKVRATGRRILWLHRAVLRHFESKSRDASVQHWEVERIVERWGTPELREPYLPPHPGLRGLTSRSAGDAIGG